MNANRWPKASFCWNFVLSEICWRLRYYLAPKTKLCIVKILQIKNTLPTLDKSDYININKTRTKFSLVDMKLFRDKKINNKEYKH